MIKQAEKIRHFVRPLFAGLAFAAGLLPAAAQKPAHNAAVYYNLHRQEGRLGAGIFTGGVVSLHDGRVHAEFNAYAGMTVTGDAAPVRVRLGGVAGVGWAGGRPFEYASPTVRVAGASKKHSLLNNFYMVATLSLHKPPTVFAGFTLPLANKGKRSSAVLIDMQRYP